MKLTTNSNTFEERGFTMLAACHRADDSVLDRLADSARSLRSDFFKQLDAIAEIARQRDISNRKEGYDV